MERMDLMLEARENGKEEMKNQKTRILLIVLVLWLFTAARRCLLDCFLYCTRRQTHKSEWTNKSKIEIAFTSVITLILLLHFVSQELISTSRIGPTQQTGIVLDTNAFLLVGLLWKTQHSLLCMSKCHLRVYLLHVNKLGKFFGSSHLSRQIPEHESESMVIARECQV